MWTKMKKNLREHAEINLQGWVKPLEIVPDLSKQECSTWSNGRFIIVIYKELKVSPWLPSNTFELYETCITWCCWTPSQPGLGLISKCNSLLLYLFDFISNLHEFSNVASNFRRSWLRDLILGFPIMMTLTNWRDIVTDSCDFWALRYTFYDTFRTFFFF